jgi:anti-sigma-K factor RskA
MKLATHKALDALIGEYLCAAMPAPVRRRFERALRDELFVSQRLDYWLRRTQIKPSMLGAVQPSPQVWQSIARDLNLAAYAQKSAAHNAAVSKNDDRASFVDRWFNWRALAASGVAVIFLMLAVQWFIPSLFAPSFDAVAQLKGTAPTQLTSIVASRSKDGKRLALKADRVLAVTEQQSFELWLLPQDGSAPVSVAVIDGFDAKSRELMLPVTLVNRVSAGAKLAISIEPRGGSKTGAPTGPVILVGAVES